MLTIVIPSKNEIFLKKTILDVLEKATGEIEVLPILDGYEPPADEIVTDPRVRYIRLPKANYSQKRHGVNLAMSQGKGKYVMSLDAHCMMAKGFDEQLTKDHRPKWVQIPRRHRLDAKRWSLQPQSDNRPPIDYEYIMWPLKFDPPALHGFKWDARTLKNWDIPIDDTIQFQGSCWFMTKEWFNKMGFMQIEGYTGWGQEAEEISLTTWKNGGRVVTNKNTWYAHLHKGPIHGRMYFLSKAENRRSYAYSYNKWMNENKDFFISLIEKFAPLPGWPTNWKERLWPTTPSFVINTTPQKDKSVKSSNRTAIYPPRPTTDNTPPQKPQSSKTANTTVIYVTQNVERPEFEDKIKEELVKNCGNLPIISVSHKPIKLGKNIRVGKVPVCQSSIVRQTLKGLEAATTEFAIIAREDYIYPPEYFIFTPPTKNQLYKYTNVWTLGDKFWQKGLSDSAQMCNRKYWIQMIKKVLDGHHGWEKINLPPVFANTDQDGWTSKNPVINFKTTSGLRRFPSVLRNVVPKIRLPFWGTATDLKKRMKHR